MEDIPQRVRIALFALIGWALLLPGPEVRAAGAGSIHEGQDVRIKRLHIDLVVNADGSYSQTMDLVEQLNSLRAVEQAGQIKLPYSASLDTLDILEANTLKADGRKLPVARTSIFTQDGLISAEGLTSFQDLKTTVAVFPTLEPGDSIGIRFRVTRRKPTLPGVFTYTHTFAGDIQNDDAVITLVAPRNYPLSIENPGLKVTMSEAPGGLRKWTWTYRNSRVEWPEDGSIDPITYRPRLLISSLASYQDLAVAANRQFAGKAAVTPAIRAAAAKITAGTSDPLTQTKKIFDWVARNIRYFSITLDVGGYIPRSADEVLASRFGDCKDHTVIVAALLAAQGIPSMPALLTTESIYELPKVPVLAVFNHAIVFVPSLNVYLDTNTSSISYGALPEVDADKPVLLLGTPQALARTPVLAAETNGTRLVSKISIAADGSASGRDVLTASGSTGIAYGGFADAVSSTDPVRLTRTILLAKGFAGEGTATARRITNEADFRFELLYELRDLAWLDQPGGVRAEAPMEFLGSSVRAEISSSPNRTVPYVCSARTDVEILDLSFPAGLSLALPRGVHAVGPDRSYDSSYSLKGSTVHVERRYVSRSPRGYCDPAEFSELRQFREKILRDLRAEIRFSPASTATAVSGQP